MELRRLAAQRRDADSVLEQPARVAVMAVRPAAGRRAHPVRGPPVPRGSADRRGEARMRELARPGTRETLELVRVRAAAQARGPAGSSSVASSARTCDLETSVEALDAAEHAHRVASEKRRSSRLDVLPDAPLDPAAGVDEL
jgi:hypothetical protein